MRVLMLAQSPVAGDSRILREATSLVMAGHDVTVVGRNVPDGFEPPPGVRVLNAGGGPGLRRSSAGRRDGVAGGAVSVARWALLPQHRSRVEAGWCAAAERLVAGERPDVVHAHDFNTLALGARVAAASGARLVYDTHEFWSGRPQVGRPTPLRRRREAAQEARLGRRADAVLTVGSGVADALQAAFGWAHVHVVRNTFPVGPPADASETRPRGLVYAGRLAPHRELEVVARASRHVDLPVTMVGPADGTWLERFDPGRAQVRPAVPISEVDELLRTAGISLITLADRGANHRLAQPNKLFHAVRVGVPVIATDVGELGRAVREHGLGELYRPGDHEDLVRAVRRLLAGYEQTAARVRAAAGALSWSHDEATLLSVYAHLDTAREPGMTG